LSLVGEYKNLFGLLTIQKCQFNLYCS